MSILSWLKSLKARLGRAPGQPIRHRNTYRPELEALETRLAPAASIDWVNQFGSSLPRADVARAVDANGDIYIAGVVNGTLPGQASAGSQDAFVRKYDAAGNELWTRQFGTVSAAQASGIAVDASGVYVTGYALGAFPGQTSAGNADAFVRKYDASGNEAWTRQFGTSSADQPNGVAVDASGVYVAGLTTGVLPGQVGAGGQDAFVRKYDVAGNVVWTRQFGTTGADSAGGVTADASGLYVAGVVNGTLPGQASAGSQDAFVRKYDAAGNVVWTRQFGSSSIDEALGVTADATGVYTVGRTGGSLPGQANAGNFDAFVRRYDVAGNEVWTRQFGSSSADSANGVAVDASGVYVAGYAQGSLPGQTSAGNLDVVLRRYDAAGNELWTRQFGTVSADQANGIAVDATGVYVVGLTGGALPGQVSTGSDDAFVRKYETSGAELWTRQFGSIFPATDVAQAVSAGGNVYVAGTVAGLLPGQSTAGGNDAFVRKYDTAGNVVWTRQFGTSADDSIRGVAVDATGLYVVGLTGDALPGQIRAGGLANVPDAFVRKYDADGNELWTRQFGTSFTDAASGVAADATGVYVVGVTTGTLSGNDGFVRKYDADGNELWTRQIDASGLDSANAVVVDASGVYVVGSVGGLLPGQTGVVGAGDAYVRKYDANGSELWTRQFGSPINDGASGVAVDASGVYVAGFTQGTLPGQAGVGGIDAFVRRYDAAGTEGWTHQFGTTSSDSALGVTADASGVYVAGSTSGTFSGQTSAGGQDAYVRWYDAGGNARDTLQFGTLGSDQASGVSVDASGLYVAGQTAGTFAGQTSAGSTDAFTAKISFNALPMAMDDSYSVAEDTTLNVAAPGVLANDSDPDGNPLSAVYVSGPTNGALTLNADGSFAYTPSANFFGTDSFSYTVSDSHGGSATGTVTVSVTPVNDPPTLDAIGDLTINEEDKGFVALSGIGSGAANELQTLTVTAVSSNHLLLPDPEVEYTSPAATGSLAWKPVADANGQATITVTVYDGQASFTRTLPVTVLPVPDVDLAVTMTDTPDPLTPSDYQLTYTIVVTNNGPDAASGVTLRDTLPAFVSLLSVTTSQGSCNTVNGVATCDLGSLAGGAGATVTVTIIAMLKGTISNQVTVTGNESDPNQGNNTAQEATTVQRSFLVVNTADDVADGVLDLISLREAIQITNDNPGVFDAIVFAIPGSGVHTIQLASALPAITAPIVIDGYSQPGARVDSPAPGNDAVLLIELNGINAGSDANGLHITAGNSVVRGLVINRFGANGVLVEGHGGDVLEGNFVGTDASGTLDRGNGGHGIWIDADDNTVGGSASASANRIAFNQGAGVRVGNFVPPGYQATLPAGYAGTGFADGAVAFNFTARDQLGNNVSLHDFYGKFVLLDICGAWCPPCQGMASQVQNTIDQLTAQGIDFAYVQLLIEDVAHNVSDQAAAQAWAARFGLSIPVLNGQPAYDAATSWLTARGLNVIPTLVFLDPELKVLDVVGGALQPEEIATTFLRDLASATGSDPVPSFLPPVHNAVVGNAIFANTGLGIDLAPNNVLGVSPNDAGDADSGPNQLQNFPVLAAFGNTFGFTTVGGTLQSTPLSIIRLQFFANSTVDPLGFGEGQTFLGETYVGTDIDGSATFSCDLSQRIDDDQLVTATATDANNNTSEFSAPVGFDNTPPHVVSSQRLDTSPTNAAVVHYRVTFSENVTGVSTQDFKLTTTDPLMLPGITGVSGSGDTYLVTVDTGSHDGTLRLDVDDDDTIRDLAGIPLGGAGFPNGNFTSGEDYTVDKNPPFVRFIVADDPQFTNASSVHFTVYFSEPVTGVDTADFRAFAHGLDGFFVSTVHGSGDTYFVTVATGNENLFPGDPPATLHLEVFDDDSILDGSGRPLGGPGVGLVPVQSPNYTVDRTGPKVVSSSRGETDPTRAACVSFLVDFNEAVSFVDPSDFALTTTGDISGASVVFVRQETGSHYVVAVNTGSGDGTIRLDVVDNNSIVDGDVTLDRVIGNPLGDFIDADDFARQGDGSFTAGQAYTVDRSAPAAALYLSTPNPSRSPLIVVGVIFSEPVSGFTAEDVIASNANVFSFEPNPFSGRQPLVGPAEYSQYLVQLMGGDGPVTVDIAAGVASDTAGNGNTAAAPLQLTLDFVNPSVLSCTPADTNPTSAAIVHFTVKFSESVTGVDAGDFLPFTHTNALNFGVGAATVASVSGSGDTYTVAVNTGTGSGALGLSVLDNNTIHDAAGNLLGGPGRDNGGFQSFDDVYHVDKSAPTVTLTSTVGSASRFPSFTVHVAISEPVDGFTVADVVASNATVTSFVVEGPGQYRVELLATAQGPVTVDIPAGVASDLAGNGNTAAAQLHFAFDSVLPTVVMTSPTTDATNSSPIPVTVTFSEPVTGFTAADIAAGNATVANFAGSGAVYTFDLTPTGQGRLTADLAANRASDAAGNGNAAAPQFRGDIFLTVDPATIAADLQRIVSGLDASTENPLPRVVLQADNNNLFNALYAVHALSVNPSGPPIDIVLNLSSGNYGGVTVSVPAGVRLTLNGSAGQVVFQGHSPALTLDSGEVLVENGVTFTNDTAAPTIQVTGGSLTLRNDNIQETTGGAQAAVWITGGTVDLGTAADPGGNILNVNGAGELIHNAGANTISALGNTFQVDGTALTDPYLIEDHIAHALDALGGGLVTYVAGNVYVSNASGSVQRGIDAVVAGGTVNVQAANHTLFHVGTKLVTVAYQNGLGLGLQADPLHPGQVMLHVVGTAGDDTIRIRTVDNDPGSIRLRINDKDLGDLKIRGAFGAPIGRIVIAGLAGNDDIKVDDDITIPAWLYGGDGNDRLQGGGGNDVLLGGDGSDLLLGGEGRDLLIGGCGADRIVGNGDDDILIAGFTAFELDPAAVNAVMAEWTRTGFGYTDRVNHLMNGGGLNDWVRINASTVTDDNDKDLLTGDNGKDWFLFNMDNDGVVKDKVTDLSAGELAVDIDS